MTPTHATSTGSFLSDKFVDQFSDKVFREIFVADQVRTRIAMMIRALREQRGLSQKELGKMMSKPQSVVSRLEDPEYGKLSVQTLLEVAAAFDLPLLIELPEWKDWFEVMKDFSSGGFEKNSFDADLLKSSATAASRLAASETQSEIKNTGAGRYLAVRDRRHTPPFGDSAQTTRGAIPGLEQRTGYRSQAQGPWLRAVS
ncbi:MAG: helix-turn-helix domain-containing protein [Hyphomonas sp.]